MARRTKTDPAQFKTQDYEVRCWNCSRYGAHDFRIFNFADLGDAREAYAKAQKNELTFKATLTQNRPTHTILERFEREA